MNRQAATALYALPAADFHDIVVGNNGFVAKPGYDLVTGRGSPLAAKVVAGLVSALPLARPMPDPVDDFPEPVRHPGRFHRDSEGGTGAIGADADVASTSASQTAGSPQDTLNPVPVIALQTPMKPEAAAVMPVFPREARESHDVLSEGDGCVGLSQNADDRMADSPAGEGSERGDDNVLETDLWADM